MRLRRRPLLARALVFVASAAVTFTGLTALTAPADAAVSETAYGFQTLAYGTRAESGTTGLRSGRTAYSYILCTRLAGLSDEEYVAEADVPPGDPNPQVHVEGVRSTSATFRTRTGDKGTRSVNRITRVVLGPDDTDVSTPTIVITGLRTTSRAWADKGGRLHTGNGVTSGDLSGETGVPEIDDVLGQVGAGVGKLIDVIQANGGSYDIPGLGTLSLGATTTEKHTGWARATATIFRLDLASIDSVVTIGRSFARINRNLPAGVMHGAGYGAEVPSAMGGLLKTGRLGTKVLPCEGTKGTWLTEGIAGLNLGNADALQLGALEGSVYGIQEKDGYGRAITEGRVTKLVLGPIVVRGIVGRAQVTRSTSGKIRKTIKGSTIGSLSTDGGQTTRDVPDPGQSLTVPGVAELTFFTKETTSRSIYVTAVKVRLLSNDYGPVDTVIRLGNARTSIKRY